jgi:hypothetical protein
VDDGVDVAAGSVDLAVNEALEIGGAAALVHRVRVEIELEDVGRRHEFRRHGSREQKAIGARGMTDADVPHRIEHVLHRQDVVGDDEIRDQIVGRGRLLRADDTLERKRGCDRP